MSIFVETVSPGSELLLAGEILDWLASAESTPSCRGLIVAAHPDDEVIGLSSRLPLLSRSCFIHVTDGAPRNLQDAQAHGYSTCEEYAGARRMEFFNSLRLAGIKDACYRCLEFPDQESSFHLSDLTLEVRDTISEHRPHFILTHSYEGGHPDHDATSFAVHNACRLLTSTGDRVPPVLEFTSYHQGPNGIEVGTFLENSTLEKLIVLTSKECERKRRLFECFATQQEVLRWFPIETERLRIAPDPNFSAPPHNGPLFYEQFSWGVDGVRWRELAAEALRALELEMEAF